MGIRERLDQLSRGELVGLVVVVVVTLVGVGFWYTRSLPRPIDVSAPAGVSGLPAAGGSGAATAGVPAGATGATGGASASGAPVPLIVDVTGQVRRPGVYEFATGDRVIDAIQRAGGAMANAELAALNLAAPLTDGTQIVVPKQGTAGAATVGAAPVPTGVSGSGALININTATAAELETLSGIGEVLAATIVEYRTENGPFTSVDQLVDVSGIGEATLEEIRDQVTI
jgi:competence protein ComEA